MNDESKKQEIIRQLELEKREEVDDLYRRAYETKLRHIGPLVHFRGLIEFSNICSKNCHYCGIRRDNHRVEALPDGGRRDTGCRPLGLREPLRFGGAAGRASARTILVAFIEQVVRDIKTLSGRQAGHHSVTGRAERGDLPPLVRSRRPPLPAAHRNLQRDALPQPPPRGSQLFHPAGVPEFMRRTGFQVGTGVMIGLPGQTLEDLADDILFFKHRDVDMIGMGPFIPHHDTPMAACLGDFKAKKTNQLELGLKMIAATRLALQDVNIAAATALQALRPNGRELGLQAGANIIMPVITETKYRTAYQLYDGKPCLDENASQCRSCLQRRIESIGETIGFDSWGDSPHFRNRQPGS